MIKYEQKKDTFILEDYDRAKTFSDFMPAVAGINGVPLWVYFVNRGQCVCSVGVNDKNNSIMEFMPANKALMNVERLGFRTFIKTDDSFVELFADKNTPKTLISENNRLTISDTLTKFLYAEVTYVQLAGKNIPALMRKLTLKNIGARELRFNCTDGIAQIVTYGISDYSLKNVSNLSCAYSNAVHSNGLIKYQVEYSTDDHAKVSKNKGANFYRSVSTDGAKPFYVYDPCLIFGNDVSLTNAEALASLSFGERRQKEQAVVFKMPSAFSSYDYSLRPQESVSIYSAVGGVKDESLLSEVTGIFRDGDAFETEFVRSQNVLGVITRNIGFDTGDELLNGYIRQSFIDNVLRGGMPVEIRDSKGNATIHYVFSRKHGDLEREYNWFVIPATKYSGGTGNYRDLCQNRRNDVIFFPFVGDYNIRMFYSFLQLDGYNPLIIKQPVYIPENPEFAQRAFEKYGVGESSRACASAGLSVGELAEIFPAEFLGDYLSCCRMEYRAEFSEGYWTDHFSYNLDLVESYLKIYPDRERELLFGTQYKYFSSGVKVLPFSERTVEENGRFFAYESIAPCGEDCWYTDRNGNEISLDLFGKIAGCALVKSATLDCNFIGLEMEGGKPGWNDSMNGLPGQNASSVPDSMEVYRINEFLIEKCALAEKFELYEEQKELFDDMVRALGGNNVYEGFLAARESFREKVYAGLRGGKVRVKTSELAALLQKIDAKIKEAVNGEMRDNKDLIPTFVPYEIVKNGNTYQRKKRRLSLFLEANAKGLKLKNFCDSQKLYRAVRNSDLFDRKLKVYKTSESIESESPLIGRVRTFSPGLYERESCFLHMHYKYLLGLLESGLYDEFYQNMKEGFVCYMDPAVYGRSPLQNSSFIVSSAGIDAALVGRGFQPRLTGANSEVLSMVLVMFFGEKMFYTENGELRFAFEPKLHNSLFDTRGETGCLLFGKTQVVYKNPEKIDTYRGRILSMQLSYKDFAVTIAGGVLAGERALDLREGRIERIIAEIGRQETC